MTKQKIFKILLIILSSLLGLLFIYSGYTKLYPIEPFEYTFVDLGIVNWALAPFVARFMIGLEFFIGLMLLFNLYLKKFTIKLTVATLAVFTIYLLVMILREGNNGNCGCFGNAIAMTPLQAVIKNVIMLGLCFLIYKFHDGFAAATTGMKKLSFWLSILFLLSSMTMPHVLNYVDLSYSEAYLNKPQDKFTLELDTLFNNSTAPKSLSKDKHVLAFMSLSCMHCRVAAKKMRIMHEKNPAISFYFVLNGDSIKLKQFYADTKTQNFPYCMLKARPFIYLAGTNLPTIYLINNSVVEHWVNYMQLNQNEVENWLKE